MLVSVAKLTTRDCIMADSKNNSQYNDRTAPFTGKRRRRKKAANQPRIKLVILFEVEEIRLRVH